MDLWFRRSWRSPVKLAGAKLVGNPRFNWTDPWVCRSGLFLSVLTVDLLAGARLVGDTCFDWTDPGIRRSRGFPGVLVVDLGDLGGGLGKIRRQVVAGDQLPLLRLPNRWCNGWLSQLEQEGPWFHR